jgi:hypothetical protein
MSSGNGLIPVCVFRLCVGLCLFTATPVLTIREPISTAGRIRPKFALLPVSSPSSAPEEEETRAAEVSDVAVHHAAERHTRGRRGRRPPVLGTAAAAPHAALQGLSNPHPSRGLPAERAGHNGVGANLRC